MNLENMSDEELRAVAGTAPAAAKRTTSPADFAQANYRHIAPVASRLRVSPEVLAAQFGLETGWGASVIPGTNNLGNIKDFSGSGVAATDSMTGSRDKYRAYKSPEDFMNDYATLIEKRYPQAIGAGNDPVRFARALKAGGYAEDPAYIRKVRDAHGLVPKYDELENMSDEELRKIALPDEPMPSFAGVKGGTVKSVGAVQAFENEVKNSLPVQAIRGVGRGIKDVIDTGAEFAARGFDRLAGTNEADRVRQMNAAGKAEYEAGKPQGAEIDAMVARGGAGAGRIGGNIAATLPLTAAAGTGIAAAGLPRLGNALASGGMTTGGKVLPGAANAAKDLAIRSIGGAGSGYISAGAVDPQSANTGAAIGAALPPALRTFGALGAATGRAIRGTGANPEVVALADRAKQLGIEIPADRLTNSKPMNAVAAGLNYVPFSGRAATELKMERQLNEAASKLIGQNSPNMTKALRDASKDLGAKFDRVLQGNAVKVDNQFLNDIASAEAQAVKELGRDALHPISKQIDEILTKGSNGVIDGQAAYNIKRTLDRIGRRNSPEAFHALELKKHLMEALNRSLGKTEADAFALTRQQYSNMLALEKLAKNGAEGEISVARLANMQNINNKPLQELADIAAQFVKPREGQHGAAQRAAAAVGIGSFGGPAYLAATVAAGRGTNAVMNSGVARNFVQNRIASPIPQTALESALYRALPQTAVNR